MTQEEFEGKFSLHKSGVFLLPQFERVGGKRVRHIARRPTDCQGAIPLASVIPKRITLYRASSKPIRENDLVLDVTSLVDQPFAVMIYVKRSPQPHPKVMIENPDWDVCKSFEVALGPYDLCAVAYAIKATFLKWQEHEVVITTGPGLDDGELEWPLVTSSGI